MWGLPCRQGLTCVLTAVALMLQTSHDSTKRQLASLKIHAKYTKDSLTKEVKSCACLLPDYALQLNAQHHAFSIYGCLSYALLVPALSSTSAGGRARNISCLVLAVI